MVLVKMLLKWFIIEWIVIERNFCGKIEIKRVATYLIAGELLIIRKVSWFWRKRQSGKLHFITITIKICKNDWLCENGNFPEKLEKIPQIGSWRSIKVKK